MKILMLTNTYLPTVGGVSESVYRFAEAMRSAGHRVLIVAPEADEAPPGEQDVIRVPAIQHFNGSDFSVRLPVPGLLTSHIDQFAPELVHTHHPFLLGDTGLRIAMSRQLPLVFTHHTMYERYTHYVPGDSPVMQRFAVEMATQYANLCRQVVAPSPSVARILRERGVRTPVTAIPTGIDVRHFSPGDRGAARRRFHIDPGRSVVGHVGRLAPEKNLDFLGQAVLRLVERRGDVTFLLAGEGPSRRKIEQQFQEQGLADRLISAGSLGGDDLVAAYRAMDVFAFTSKTETQGMVLAEAMGCGVPAVALDAPGARDVVTDGVNGRLLTGESIAQFAEVLELLLDDPGQDTLGRAARQTATTLSTARCCRRLLRLYRRLIESKTTFAPHSDSHWTQLQRRIAAEWELWSGRLTAATKTLS